jgi:hypothetical protein
MDNWLIVQYHRDGAMEGRSGIAQPPQWMAVPSVVVGEGVGKSAPETKARWRYLRVTSE